MTTTPRLLRDVITIPEVVHKGDLVFRLADGADDPAKTVRDYVVTDQLTTAFMDAVKLLRSAVNDGVSKAAYLHGSFGSGKSNFMAVLQLLLDGDVHARAKPALAPVVAELDRGTGAYLTVPFHLIGEDTLESAVFGQYVDHLAKVHPEAPPPAVYADEPILTNADELRARLGDDTFFAQLSESDGGFGGDDGWGDLSSAWDPTSYDAARRGAHGSAERIRLVQALLSTLLSSYAEGARANRAGYVAFDDGLAALSTHAQTLGYDGLILFLDELILWFLSRLGDTNWVSREAAKLSKLVEGASAERPVPIVAIIARQRDLRTLVGDDVEGLEKLSFVDQLDYQAGRFSVIELDDSNLPVVAHARLLEPVDDEAAAVLAAAFAGLSLSPKVRDALLGDAGDDAAFALTYPFSPAFMAVLVDVAGALQRTRTGLRVLLDLLVARRDVLEIGQLVPVGDLWDVIEASDDPLSDLMRSAFDQARKVYRERLRPALLADHALSAQDQPTAAFTADDRLVKTLLLAALVPQSAPFRDLTVERLVALNHGTISSPVPGQETAIATNKLRRLAAHVGELRLGTDPNNPTVTVVLSDVDPSAILATADGVDNQASRRTLLRRMVLGALGLPDDQLQATYTLVWKGLRREVAIGFGNLRDTADLPDHAFVNDGPGWKLLVDFPFDEPGHSPLEDLERLDRLRQNGSNWHTLCWLPGFFTAPILDLVGRLVRLDHVLANDDRFSEATATLNPTARASAKPVLEAMQSATRSRLEGALLAAYGVTGSSEGTVDPSHTLADHFPSLRAGLTIQPPAAATLRDALERVLDQALRHSFPGAPDLGGTDGTNEVRATEVRKVAQLAQDAVVEPEGRLVVADAADRKLLTRIANPLKIGLQSEQAFKLQTTADHWDTTFTRAINAAGADGVSPTVGLLRRAVNTPDAQGLTAALENLVIVVWAQATNHTFQHHGGPVDASVDRLDDAWAVVPQALPSSAVWQEAVDRLAAVFGVTLPSRHRSGFTLERAGVELARATAERSSAAAALLDRLERVGGELGLDPLASQRQRTARGATALFDTLAAADDDLARVEALAAATIEPSALALGRSITSAADLVARIDATQFDIVHGALARPEGQPLRVELTTALAADEFVTALGPVLADIQTRAVAILAGTGPTPPLPPVAPPPAPPPPPETAGTRTWTGTGVADANRQLEELAELIGTGTVTDLSVTITWTERPDHNEGNPG